jgi:hypothetical protein
MWRTEGCSLVIGMGRPTGLQETSKRRIVEKHEVVDGRIWRRIGEREVEEDLEEKTED